MYARMHVCKIWLPEVSGKKIPEGKIAEMNEEATPLNTKKSTKLGLGVLDASFYFLVP